MPKRNILSQSKLYTGYRFREKTPDLYELTHLIQISGKSIEEIAKGTGLLTKTIQSWFTGEVLCPRADSIRAVILFLDVHKKWFTADGAEIVIPGMSQEEREWLTKRQRWLDAHYAMRKAKRQAERKAS